MYDTTIVMWRGLLAATLLAGLLGALWWRKRSGFIDRLGDRSIVGLFLCSRLAGFALVHLLLKMKFSSDLLLYYMPAAESLLAGQLPYRDFYFVYGFFFDYLLAGMLLLWHSYKIFIVFNCLLEALLVKLLLVAMRDSHAPRTLTITVMLFLFFSPIEYMHVAISASNQQWVTVFALLSLLALSRARDVGGGVLLACGGAIAKASCALFAPGLLLYARRPLRYLVGAGITAALYLGFVRACGADPLFPLHDQLLDAHELMTNTIWFYLQAWLGTSTLPVSRPFFTLLFVALALLCVAIRSLRGRGDINLALAGMVAVWAAQLGLSLRSNSWYEVSILPLALWWSEATGRRTLTWALALFGVLATFNMSFHSNLLGFPTALLLFQRHDVADCAFLLIDLSMLAAILWMYCVASADLVRALCRQPAPAAAIENAAT